MGIVVGKGDQLSINMQVWTLLMIVKLEELTVSKTARSMACICTGK